VNLTATATAHPNLAFVKYWGQSDTALHIPANGSISMNLSAALTTTTVTFLDDLDADDVVLNGLAADAVTRQRVSAHLDRVRALAGLGARARVVSSNSYPTAAGVASSAAAFAALSLAATAAVDLDLSERALSILARKGSGSACRSIPDGFVEWTRGEDDASSWACSLAPLDHWRLCVITVSPTQTPKAVPSLIGHRAARTSPLYDQRRDSAEGRLHTVRQAIADRDLEALGMAAEREAAWLHAVAMTSTVADRPWLSGIYYMTPLTVRLIHAIQRWRAAGLAVYFTLDAGPAVHLICEESSERLVLDALDSLSDLGKIQRLVSYPGPGARLVSP
jgi:diphosphomevalonate decarboxylase